MMDKPYDPTLKDLVETSPADWLALVDASVAPVVVIDADIATISGAADKVLLVQAEPEWLLHLEFHSGHDGATLPGVLHMRNALLGYRHDRAVRSVVLVLRHQADSPRLNGTFARPLPGRNELYNPFEFSVVRVWQLDPERILRGGIGTLPLAPISNVTESQLPGIIQRMGQRFTQSRIPRKSRASLWGATYILLGLRYSAALAQQLLTGVISMKESTTYQAILQEGRAVGLAEGRAVGLAEGRAEGQVQEARAILVDLGSELFGSPDAATQATLEAITDEPRLRALIFGLRTAKSWEDLLQTPGPGPSRRKRGRRPS